MSAYSRLATFILNPAEGVCINTRIKCSRPQQSIGEKLNPETLKFVLKIKNVSFGLYSL